MDPARPFIYKNILNKNIATYLACLEICNHGHHTISMKEIYSCQKPDHSKGRNHENVNDRTLSGLISAHGMFNSIEENNLQWVTLTDHTNKAIREKQITHC